METSWATYGRSSPYDPSVTKPVVTCLAIAVYHESPDFWRTFDFVMELCPESQVYIRHYIAGWSAMVMYFVPEGRL